MKPKDRSPLARRQLLVAAACAWASAAAAAPDAGVPPDPADAGVAVPPTVYRGALPDTAGGYLEATDAPRLAWPHLFGPDGAFAADAGPAASDLPAAAPVASDHAGHAMPTNTPPAGAMPMGTQPPGATPKSTSPEGHAMTPADSDARGVVKAVDAAQGKLKLEHGPIAKWDMPGMTMVFRVRDKALLDGLKPGDEVGFTVEMDGTTMLVTGVTR